MGKVDKAISYIRLIFPLSILIQFEEEVAECFFLVIPLQFVIIQYQIVCPDDVILCIYLFLIFFFVVFFDCKPDRASICLQSSCGSKASLPPITLRML